MKNNRITNPLSQKKAKSGFTLIEVLIVVGVTIVLAAGGLAAYKGFFLNNQLNEAAQKTISALRNAQNKATFGENNSNWGLYIVHQASGGDYYNLYYGTSSSTGTSTATSYYASSVQVDASYDINFLRLTGTTSQKTTVTLSLVSNPSSKQCFVVDTSGIVYGQACM